MTLPATTRRSPVYAGNGAVVTFPFTFKVFAATDVQVRLTSALGALSTATLGTDYNVVLNADQTISPGGTILYPITGVPLAIGASLVALGNLPYDQTLALPAGGNFNPVAVERGLDRIEMQVQQVAELAGRGVRAPAGETLSDLPPANIRANGISAFDSLGQPITVPGQSGTATSLALDLANSATVSKGAGQIGFNVSLPYAAGTAGKWLTDLTAASTAAQGAGQVGFGYSLVYAAGTIGKWLRDLATSAGATLIGFLQAGTGAVLRTLQAKMSDTVSVLDFGAARDGVTDDYPAFAAAWAAVKPTGGQLFIPPGNYLLNSQWVCDVDLTLPHNYQIRGYGATLFAGAAVTGFAMRVYKGFNNFGVSIEGLQFNHRNNTTVGGAIQAQGAVNLRLAKVCVEVHNSKAGYAVVELGPFTIGDKNTNTFYTLIDGLTVRQRTGGEGTNAAIGVRLFGDANATNIVNCAFNYCVDAIRLDTDGTWTELANGVLISGNDFEVCTNAVTINTASPALYTPLGLRVNNNRSELITTFLNFTGAAVSNSGTPPMLRDNFFSPGTVTNYILNPNSQTVFTSENGISLPVTVAKQGGPMTTTVIAEGVGKNFQIANLSGASGWDGAHLMLGNYHFWVDGATGKFYLKSSAPTSATDGTVVGTQT